MLLQSKDTQNIRICICLSFWISNSQILPSNSTATMPRKATSTPFDFIRNDTPKPQLLHNSNFGAPRSRILVSRPSRNRDIANTHIPVVSRRRWLRKPINGMIAPHWILPDPKSFQPHNTDSRISSNSRLPKEKLPQPRCPVPQPHRHLISSPND